MSRLWSELKERMLKHSHQLICEENGEMTFEEAIVFAESFAPRLKDESCCAILCHSEMMAALALLSCFVANVAAVPLSERYGDKHAKKILHKISPTAIILEQNGSLQVLHIQDSEYTEPDIHPALILCTSGTTGEPKGAMLTEDNILTNVKDICSYFALLPTDSILIARPLYHGAVLTGEFLTSLMLGCRIRFSSRPFQPKELLNTITDYGITVFCGTPTLLTLMAHFSKKNTHLPRMLCVSGECMGKSTGRRIAEAFPQADIYHVYGLTEACPRVSWLPPSLFRGHEDSVGIPLPSVSIKILKNDGTPVDVKEEGVLWVKGDNIMAGYYKDPEKTAEVLKDGWLCTGDIAVIDEDGLLSIRGRQDDLIIRAGMNVYPAEIENVLKMDYRVKDALVWGSAHPKMGVQIGLKVVGDFADTEEIKALCQECLPTYQIPTVIYLVDELPQNASGKTIRH